MLAWGLYAQRGRRPKTISQGQRDLLDQWVKMPSLPYASSSTCLSGLNLAPASAWLFCFFVHSHEHQGHSLPLVFESIKMEGVLSTNYGPMRGILNSSKGQKDFWGYYSPVDMQQGVSDSLKSSPLQPSLYLLKLWPERSPMNAEEANGGCLWTPTTGHSPSPLPRFPMLWGEPFWF